MATDTQADENTLFKFPCKFPLKVMCEHDESLVDTVKKILLANAVAEKTINLHTRNSSNGKYLSITATFTANSKLQLDNIYSTLSKHDKVKMVL